MTEEQNAVTVKVEQEENQIFFVRGNLRAGPFPANPEKFEVGTISRVAGQLEIPGAVVARAHSEWLSTKEGTPKTFDAGDERITPNLDSSFVEIHPAIGVIGDKAYVGIWIPSEVTNSKGRREVAAHLYLVTSDRELVLASEDYLLKRNWTLSHSPLRFPNRWNIKDVKAFLEGTDRPCDGILSEVVSIWRRYIEFAGENDCLYNAMWTILTYFSHLFKSFPYLYFGGMKRTGKTKGLTLHAALDFNAIFSNNMSTASLYRLIQNAHCTLLIDETEKLSNPERAQEFRTLLLSGYQQGSVVYRVEKTSKEKLVPEAFGVYGPKALANIGGIEDVLQDRCHEIIMPRGLDPKLVNTEVRLDDPLWEQTRDRLYQFYLAECSSVAQAYQLVCEAFVHAFEGSDMDDPISIAIRVAGVSSRDLELWKPLFAMGYFLDSDAGRKYRGDLFSEGSMFACMLAMAIKESKRRQVEDLTETADSLLVQTLTRKVQRDEYYPVREVRDWLAAWYAVDEEQKWLGTRWVGNALRRLGFSEKRRVGTGYEYFLTVSAVKNLGIRLGLIEPKEGSERSEHSEQVNVAKGGKEEQFQSPDSQKDTSLTKFTSSLPSPSSPSNEAGGDTQ